MILHTFGLFWWLWAIIVHTFAVQVPGVVLESDSLLAVANLRPCAFFVRM